MNRVWILFIRDRRITQQVLILSIAYLSPSFNGPCEGASIANRGAYKIPVDSKGVQGWVSGMAIYIFLWSWNAVNVEDSFVRSLVLGVKIVCRKVKGLQWRPLYFHSRCCRVATGELNREMSRGCRSLKSSGSSHDCFESTRAGK